MSGRGGHVSLLFFVLLADQNEERIHEEERKERRRNSRQTEDPIATIFLLWKLRPLCVRVVCVARMPVLCVCAVYLSSTRFFFFFSSCREFVRLLYVCCPVPILNHELPPADTYWNGGCLPWVRPRWASTGHVVACVRLVLIMTDYLGWRDVK